MNNLLIGNIVALFAAVLMVIIGFVRSKKNILKLQCVQFGLYAVSNFILGGVTGSLANIFSIIRNMRCIKKDISLFEKMIYIILQIVFSALLNTSGLLGWAPVIATCIYTLLMTTKDEVVLKLVSIFGTCFWVYFDFSIRNYVSFSFDVASIISTIVGIISVISLRKKLANEKVQF